MAHYVTSVATPMSVEDAFAYMADVTNFAAWDPGVSRAIRVSGADATVGTSYDLTVKSGFTTVMRYVVKEVSAPRRVVLVARTSTLTSVDEVRVEPDGTGSVVTYDAVLTLNGPLRIFDRLLALAFKRIGDRAAVGLRKALGGTETSPR